MKKVHIIHDIYDKNSGTVAEVKSVLDYLKNEFTEFPKHARIYHKHWNNDCDITEKLQQNENYADGLDGDIYVVIYPSYEPITIFMLAVMAITAAFSIYTYMTMPKPKAQQQESPNNELSNRSNSMRPNGRIPEIFGKLRAYPDLIAQPYVFFDEESGKEIEHCLMVLGKGYYSIHDVREGFTDVTSINGTSVSIYNPDDNLIGDPFLRIGEPFTEETIYAQKSEAINGQSILKPNDQVLESSAIWFEYPNKIRCTDDENFVLLFGSSEKIVIENAQFGVPNQAISGSIRINNLNQVIVTSSKDIADVDNFKGLSMVGALVDIETTYGDPPQTTKAKVDLSGNFNISLITKTIVNSYFVYTIDLLSPENINPNWSAVNKEYSIIAGLELNKNINSLNLDGTYDIQIISANEIHVLNTNEQWEDLQYLQVGSTIGQNVSIILSTITDKYIGWYNLNMPTATEFSLNILFTNGLYWQSRSGRRDPQRFDVKIEYQKIDSNGNPVGFTSTKIESYFLNIQKSFGKTIFVQLGFEGSFRFRVSAIYAVDGNTIADCKLRDVYGINKNTPDNYKNVTVVRSRTIGTDGALSLKERKLNCLVTRRLPLNGTGALIATKSAAQALIYLALDDKNGRRKLSEVDIAQILSEEQKAIAYFGSELATEFSYTIDGDNLSFEEITGMVSSSMFCEAYRYGSKLRVRFEEPQQTSVLLFNHRNTTVKSMTRTKSYGIKDNFDGVEIEYTSPDDDTRINYIATDSLNPNNLKKITTSGIRTHEQAKTRAWREWNKQKWQNISVEFEALEESELLARNDRILVADNTKLSTIDGEVEVVNGRILELSQPVSIGSYDIYLQLPDASVDIIPCVQVDEWSVQLSRMPLINLSIGKAFYQLISVIDDKTKNAYLVTEIRPQGKMTNTLTCVNYDARYYEKDHEFFGSEV